ncbi:MAG: glycosyltransferase family 4 protein, partial [Thermoanaerobaculia bacterium]|nr:glycosyltransferase family 4 protein [Thermoanaerobaculia bacterium]
RSGIADYSAELLPHLAKELEIEVYTTPRAVRRADPEEGWTTFPYRDFTPRDRRNRFDLVLYQMGNDDRHHGRIYELLLERPGVVLLHEFLLHHLIRERTLVAGDADAYVEELRYSYGATGQAAGRRLVDLDLPLDVWRFPLFERVVDRSLGVLVHNEFSRRRILAGRPRTRIAIVPSPVGMETVSSPGTPEDRSSLRRSLGLPVEGFLLGSFGLATPLKRLDVALRAFQRLRRNRPDAHYVLVGPVSPYYDLEGLLSGGLGEGVAVQGRVDLDTFHRSMEAVDLAVNLRYPSAGETSATLLRLMALARPVIVTDHGPSAELPDDACVKVAPDGFEEPILAEMFEALAADDALRRRIGDNAREHIRKHHHPEDTSRGILSFLTAIRKVDPEPPLPVPPLASFPPEDVATRTIADIAAGCADLGVEETDRALLGAVAEELEDLGFGP